MKKMLLSAAVAAMTMFGANAQTAVWDKSEISVWANGAAASILKESGGVKIEQIGTEGSAASEGYIQLGNNNKNLVLNSTSNDAIIITSTADITSFKLSYSGNGNTNSSQPYIGYHSEPTAMGSESAIVSSCDLGELVTGNATAAQQKTFTPAAGTKFIIVARGAACGDASNESSIRITRIEVYTNGGDPVEPIEPVEPTDVYPGTILKEWNLGDDAVNFPVIAGQAAITTINGLTITPKNPMTGTIPANMGQVEVAEKSFSDIVYPNRFKFNGGGYSNAAATDATPTVNMPTQRYLSFDVTSDCFITLRGITGNNPSARKVFLTNGTTLVGTFNYPANTESDGAGGVIANVVEESILYKGGAATLYLFCNASCNLYHIFVQATDGAASSVSDISVNKTVKSVMYYDVMGRQATEATKGIIIKKTIYEDGTSSTVKTTNVIK